MDLILQGLLWEGCLAYIDDILIFGREMRENNQRLIHVLQRLSDAHLFIRMNKGQYAQKELLYLGHRISGEGIATSLSHVEAVSKFPTPKTPADVQQFIGLVGFSRRFIRDFVSKSWPLVELYKKDSVFIWEEPQQRAFQESFRKTGTLVRRRYWWKGMAQDIQQYCKTCRECQEYRNRSNLNKGVPMSLPVASRPHQMIGVDYIGKLTRTKQGNEYILVFVDHFTKWPEARVSADAATTAQIFIDFWICPHGIPDILISDRGS
ncbi:enzymatic polyprotein endonuclease reverse [Pelomyxa schiedti]|nr:enzymatic polyprotein endonuclease reverse [Pelomyxa schiedti]